MAFQDDLARHADQVRARIPHIKGEEATKQALVVPLLQLLGYDIYDPREVCPEYIADFAVKKQGQFEKVDYLVAVDGKKAFFVECKSVQTLLHDHGGQLSRYFNATPEVRVAMITDGQRIQVFTDLLQPNVMDETPWLDIDLLALKPAAIDALKRFRKSEFSAEDIVALAEEMVYYNKLVEVVARQLQEPSESFVRWVAGEIPSISRTTAKVVERLTPILRKAVHAAIVDHVARSFERPPESAAPPPVPEPQPAVPEAGRGDTPIETRAGVETTVDELATWHTIAGWIHEVHPDAELAYKDSKSYFAIHQANTRKWFVRFNLDKRPGWIGLRHLSLDEARSLAPGFDVTEGGAGLARFSIARLDDLVKLRSAVIAAHTREAARVADDATDDGA